jgi:hypothetical protein
MRVKPASRPPEPPDLSISTETVCAIISMARQFDAKDEVTEPDPDSNPSDDGGVAILEDHRDDPVELELKTFIHDLNVDERVDLVALVWLGRGDADIDGWAELRVEAARNQARSTAKYLLGIPLLSDYLAEALSLFGRSCDDVDADRL